MLNLSLVQPFEDENGMWVLESCLDLFAKAVFNKDNHSRISRKVYERIFECKVDYKNPLEFGATNRFRVKMNKSVINDRKVAGGAFKVSDLFNMKNTTMAFDTSRMKISVVNNGDRKMYNVYCPVCHSNKFTKKNWYEAKEYDKPLLFECSHCHTVTEENDLLIEEE